VRRVCRIKVDPDRYQAFAPSSPAPQFAGEQLGSLGDVILSPVNPTPESSDFYALWIGGAFACSEAAAQMMGPSLTHYGELLPVQVVSGRGVLIFNCTNVVDCLDDQGTTWKIGERSGARLWVLKYVFDPARLPIDGQPFKLPQTALTELFIVDDPQDRPGSSLISQVTKAGLVGLRLDPIVEFSIRPAPR
jgi:hypothetical protein